MSGLWRYLFRDNPMQIETLRAVRRFRVTSGRTVAIQRNVARVLIGLVCALYAWFLVTILTYREDISEGIFWFEFVLLTLLVPGSLYEAISGERERLTWDSLILTNLSPTRILVGKLLWRLGLVAGIMLLFLPPLLLTHFATRFPTVYTLGNLFWMQAILTSWCVFLATFTLWVSSRTKRSVVTLSIVMVFLLAALILVPSLVSLFGVRFDDMPQPYSHGLSPTALLGSLWIHLTPWYAIVSLGTQALERPGDYFRDFLGPAQVLGHPPVTGIGILTILPAIYLAFAGLCLNRTLKALARLGLPGGATR
jgi:hypothetical protein